MRSSSLSKCAVLSLLAAVCSGCGRKASTAPVARSQEPGRAVVAPLIRQAAALSGNPDDTVDFMKAPVTGQKWVKLTKDIPVWPDATMNAYIDVRYRATPNDGGEIYFERHATRREWQDDSKVRFVMDGRTWQPKSTVMADNIPGATAETVRVKVSLAQLSLLVTAREVEVHVGKHSAALKPEHRWPLAGLVKKWMLETGAN